MRQRPARRGRLARCGGLAHRRTADRGFDHNIIGPADHDQMFDVVAPHQHQLALPVEVENIDKGEPRLAPAIARPIELPSAENSAQHDDKHADRDDDEREQKNGDEAVKNTEDLHAGRTILQNCKINRFNSSTHGCRCRKRLING